MGKNNSSKFFFYPQTTSTNDEAKKHLIEGKKTLCLKNLKPWIFLTNFQTRGRGRRKRVWINSDLMISFKYRLKYPLKLKISYLNAKALKLALQTISEDIDIKIKKPNDLIMKGQKVGGVLIEIISLPPWHDLIIGVGLNVFTHPPGFTCLQKHLPFKITKKHWLTFLNNWQKNIEQVIKKSLTTKC